MRGKISYNMAKYEWSYQKFIHASLVWKKMPINIHFTIFNSVLNTHMFKWTHSDFIREERHREKPWYSPHIWPPFRQLADSWVKSSTLHYESQMNGDGGPLTLPLSCQHRKWLGFATTIEPGQTATSSFHLDIPKMVMDSHQKLKMDYSI